MYHIARSRTYTGEWTADRARKLFITVPRIVSDELWERAQLALARHGRRGIRRVRHVYLLEGIGVCGPCGAPISVRSRFSRGLRCKPSPALYVCRDRRRPAPGITPCQAPSPKVADVDARVWGVVEREINDPDLLAHVIALEKRRTGERRDWSADAKAARDRLARLERSESGVLRRYREGAISEGAIDTELAEIRRAREMARQQLTAAERRRLESTRARAGSPCFATA